MDSFLNWHFIDFACFTEQPLTLYIKLMVQKIAINIFDNIAGNEFFKKIAFLFDSNKSGSFLWSMLCGGFPFPSTRVLVAAVATA